MGLPIAPIARIAIRYGAVAVASYAATRRLERGRRDQRAEDAMDDLEEGLFVRREKNQINGSGRFRRVIRLGRDGAGIEIDIAGHSRFKVRRI